MNRQDLINRLTVKTETFELKSIKSLGLEDAKATLKELTIAETKEFNNKLREKGQDEAFLYACRCSMVEPAFFTDDQLKTFSNYATVIINEVITLIPLIGKTQEEKAKYKELMEKVAKSEDREELTEEELEKK